MGAEEDVDFFGSEVSEGVFEGVLFAGGVGVESGDASTFEDFVEDGFGFFGAEAVEADGGVVTVGAGFGDDCLVSADVADESFF